VEVAVHEKAGKTLRTVAAALVLASSACVVLGTTPASADTTFMDFQLAYHGSRFPSNTDAQNETRPAADRQCVATYGFRAREVQPYTLYALRQPNGTNNWYQSWHCYSN
jgi:hypothetical protein